MFLECFYGLFTKQKGWINKLNGRWTPAVLVMLSAVSFICRYIEDPVSCWCPAEFQASMVSYANRYCWRIHLIDMHPVIMAEIPKFESLPIKMNKSNSWIMWIPLILLFQAALFKIIAIIMHFGERKFGFQERKLRGLTAGYKMLSLEERAKFGKQLGFYLNQWRKSRLLAGLPFGELSITVIFVYALYLGNVIAQFVLMDRLLKDPNAKTYGTHLANNLFGNNSILWIESPAFVKTFMCDFQIRQLNTVQRYTIQCINNINLVFEQIYAFLWVWFLVTAVISFCGCALKVLQILLPCFRTRYVKHYLLSGNITIPNENDVSRLANSILGEDGVMALKGISEVSSEFLVRDAIINMWSLNFGEGSTFQQQQQQLVGNTQQTFVQHPVQFQNVRHSTNTPYYAPMTNISTSSSREESIPLAEVSGKDKTS